MGSAGASALAVVAAAAAACLAVGMGAVGASTAILQNFPRFYFIFFKYLRINL